MQHRISSATAHSNGTVTLTWDGGEIGTVDFAPNIERGGVCAPMADPDFFVAKIRVADQGCVLAWSDEIEFSADSLWYRLHPDDLRRDYPEVAAE